MTVPGLDHSLTRLAGATLTSSGRFVVCLPSDGQLLTFDEGGRFVAAVGRVGSGPGEMRTPMLLGARRDSVWLFDASLARITVFTPELRVARTIAVPASGIGALHDDGSVTIHSSRTFDLVDHEREMLRIQRLGSSGRVVSDSFVAPLGRRTLRYDTRAGVIVGEQPFDDNPLLAPAPGVNGFYYVSYRTRSSGPYEVLVDFRDPRWRLVWSRKIPYRPQPLTPKRMEEFVERILNERGRVHDVQERSAVQRALFLPPHVPTVSRAVTTNDGTLWLRREEQTDSVLWSAVDPRGQIGPTLRLARGDVPLAARLPLVWWGALNADGEFDLWLGRIRAPHS